MRTFRYMLKSLLAAVFSLSFLCMAAGVVFAAPAHAKVNRADPGIGSTIKAVPTKVTVFTEENIDVSKSPMLIVYGPSADATDTVVSQGNVQIPLSNPMQMSINITPNKGYTNGVYIVYWKTVSADDGDEADGKFTFTVNPNGAIAGSTQNSTSASSGTPIWVPIVAGIAALLIGLGVGLGLGRRKTAPARSSLGAMRSEVAEELKQK